MPAVQVDAAHFDLDTAEAPTLLGGLGRVDRDPYSVLALRDQAGWDIPAQRLLSFEPPAHLFTAARSRGRSYFGTVDVNEAPVGASGVKFIGYQPRRRDRAAPGEVGVRADVVGRHVLGAQIVRPHCDARDHHRRGGAGDIRRGVHTPAQPSPERAGHHDDDKQNIQARFPGVHAATARGGVTIRCITHCAAFLRSECPAPGFARNEALRIHLSGCDRAALPLRNQSIARSPARRKARIGLLLTTPGRIAAAAGSCGSARASAFESALLCRSASLCGWAWASVSTWPCSWQ